MNNVLEHEYPLTFIVFQYILQSHRNVVIEFKKKKRNGVNLQGIIRGIHTIKITLTKLLI